MKYLLTCAVCGREFRRHSTSARFCSRICAGAALRTGWRPPADLPPPRDLSPCTGVPMPPLEPRPCARCGLLFSPVNREKPGMYCSVHCRVAAEHDALAYG